MLRRVLAVCGGVIVMICVGVLGLGASWVFAQTQEDSRLYVLPRPTNRLVMSSSMTLARESRLLITANMLNNTVSIVELNAGTVQAEVSVGRDPRTVVTTPDNTRVVVVNRGDGTISVIDLATRSVIATYPVGILPYAVITLDDNTAAVSLQGENQIVTVDLSTGAVTNRVTVSAAPAGLTLWGDLLYVAHLWSGRLSLIYVPPMRLVESISLGRDVALSQSITIDPQRGVAYLPQTRLNAASRTLTYDTVAFPIVNAVDLTDLSLQRIAQIPLDSALTPVNMPFAAAVDIQKRWIYVANAGSNNISLIDLTRNAGIVSIPTKSNPRSLILTRDGATLYVHNMIEGTVSVVQTRDFRVIDEIPVSILNIPSDVFVGAQLFHTAIDRRLSADRWLSCATCHFDGQSDGRVWQGFIGGARNTPNLYNLRDYPLLNASGSWNELADLEHKIRGLQAGSGLISGTLNPPLETPHAGLSPDLDTLTTYLLTLEGPKARPAWDDAQVLRGAEVFAEANCAACHMGESGVDGLRHDVGTGDENVSQFATPTLRWLWLSAPYFHDGSAETLMDVFLQPGAHQLVRTVAYNDIEALVAYLNTLPQSSS